MDERATRGRLIVPLHLHPVGVLLPFLSSTFTHFVHVASCLSRWPYTPRIAPENIVRA
jgi:hypothetical protein